MKHARGYTAVYTPRTLAGESGHDYEVYADGRLVMEGWTRGRKNNAEADVREGINAREALLSAVRKAS